MFDLVKLNTILPPITTPFINDELSIPDLVSNIKKYNEYNLGGYVVLGSNGENVFLTKSEKLDIIRTVREQTSQDKIVITGTGYESIKDTIKFTNEAADLGTDASLIITPSFFKNEMKKDVFIRYYTEIADCVKIPVIIYNVPKFTNINIEVETVVELSQHKNIIGIKNSSENIAQLEQFAANTPDDFKILIGTASVLFPGLLVGATGAIIALANVTPDKCITLLNLVKSMKLSEAKTLQDRLIPVNTSITSSYVVAGLKAAMDLTGFFGGDPRRPLIKLDNNQLNQLKIILTKASLLG